MGGNSEATTQAVQGLSSLFNNSATGQSNAQPNPLQTLFGGSQGYTQAPVAQIQAPQYPAPLTPSPEDAAAATRARMQARSPMAAPVAAPVINKPRGYADYSNGSMGVSPWRGH